MADRDADADAVDEAPAASNAGARSRGDRILSVSIHIELGAPVRVRKQAVAVDGEGNLDKTVADALSAFVPKQGAVLDHRLYEASKSRVAGAMSYQCVVLSCSARNRVSGGSSFRRSSGHSSSQVAPIA